MLSKNKPWLEFDSYSEEEKAQYLKATRRRIGIYAVISAIALILSVLLSKWGDSNGAAAFFCVTLPVIIAVVAAVAAIKNAWRLHKLHKTMKKD